MIYVLAALAGMAALAATIKGADRLVDYVYDHPYRGWTPLTPIDKAYDRDSLTWVEALLIVPYLLLLIAMGLLGAVLFFAPTILAVLLVLELA